VGFGFGEVLETRAFLCDMPSGVLCSTRSFKYRDIQALREQVNVLFLFQSQYFEWWMLLPHLRCKFWRTLLGNVPLSWRLYVCSLMTQVKNIVVNLTWQKQGFKIYFGVLNPNIERWNIKPHHQF